MKLCQVNIAVIVTSNETKIVRGEFSDRIMYEYFQYRV